MREGAHFGLVLLLLLLPAWVVAFSAPVGPPKLAGPAAVRAEGRIGREQDTPSTLDDTLCLIPGEVTVRIEDAPSNSRRIFAGIDVQAGEVGALCEKSSRYATCHAEN